MHCFSWSKEENYCILPGDQYNEEFNNWSETIDNSQFQSHSIKDKINTKAICTKYSGFVKFNGISREVNPETPTKSYKDQCREHMTTNVLWGVLSLLDTQNKYNMWYILLHKSRFTSDYV